MNAIISTDVLNSTGAFFVTKNATIDELRVNEPILHAEQDGEGWTIAQLIKKQEGEADRAGPLSSIRIDSIGISNGSVIVAEALERSGVRIKILIIQASACGGSQVKVFIS